MVDLWFVFLMCVVSCVSLTVGSCLLFVLVVCGSLMAAGGSLFAVRCSLFVVCC